MTTNRNPSPIQVGYRRMAADLWQETEKLQQELLAHAGRDSNDGSTTPTVADVADLTNALLLVRGARTYVTGKTREELAS